MKRKPLLHEIAQSPQGDLLRNFLTEKVKELNDVSTLPKNWTYKDRAVEVTARQHAIKKLQEIYEEILPIQEEEVEANDEMRIYYGQ